jgi:hypothetical protein
VVGDPVYRSELESRGQVPSRASGSVPLPPLLELDRLPATREEAREISELLILQDPEATDEERRRLLESAVKRDATLSTRLFDLRLGSEASLASLPPDLSAYTNLHFAVHGHVNTLDCRHSGLVLSWEPESGGLFQLEDLLTLRLDADLVVLSACETAAGPIVRGEGVQSLASAFIEAGARSVIASLWKVADPDAAEIMKSLYRENLTGRQVPSEALRLAKLSYRAARKPRGSSRGNAGSAGADPAVWSAFVFMGSQAR